MRNRRFGVYIGEEKIGVANERGVRGSRSVADGLEVEGRWRCCKLLGFVMGNFRWDCGLVDRLKWGFESSIWLLQYI